MAVAGVVLGLFTSVGCTGEETPAEPDEGTSTSASGSSGEPGSSSGGEPGTPVSLVRPDFWELAAAADDPFADHRPMYVQCELGWEEETGLFEVDTGLCVYGAFVQSTLAPIHAGDELELVLLHDALYSEEGEAAAHVGLAFGSEIAWQTELPIPSEAGQARPTWTATTDLEVGTPVHFHVHNHGTNNYRLVALTVTEQ